MISKSGSGVGENVFMNHGGREKPSWVRYGKSEYDYSWHLGFFIMGNTSRKENFGVCCKTSSQSIRERQVDLVNIIVYDFSWNCQKAIINFVVINFLQSVVFPWFLIWLFRAISFPFSNSQLVQKSFHHLKMRKVYVLFITEIQRKI